MGERSLAGRSVRMPKYTIQFSKRTDRDLERLAKALGVSSKADVIRKAVNLLRYVLEEQKAGGKLVMENSRDKTKKELVPI